MNKNKKNIKKVKTASITLAVAAGAALSVAALNSDNDFIPTFSNRQIKENQVHFSGEGNAANQGDTQESSLLEKSGQNNINTNDNQQFLFDGMVMDDTGIGNIYNISDSTGLTEEGTGLDNAGGNIYDIVSGGQKSDLVISGNQTSGNGNPGGSNSSSQGSGNNGTADGGHDNSDTESKDIADIIKDPLANKEYPGIMGSHIKIEDFKGDSLDGIDEKQLIVWISQKTDADTYQIYKGSTVSDYDIFSAMDTYVIDKSVGDRWFMYNWGKNSYGKYIKVTGISLDGGKSWKTSFPVTIPDNMNGNDMKIKVSYKLGDKADWVEYIVDYQVADNRIMILSKSLSSDSEYIDKDDIISSDQYPQVGSITNLYGLQWKILQSNSQGNLDYLFPGWYEKGKAVSWFYENKAGRHILQPYDMVPLDDKYTAALRYYNMYSDGSIQYSGFDWDSTPVALQTLTAVDMDGSVNITVPQYIQMVDLQTRTEVEYMTIPDSVIGINMETSMLRVKNGYIVSRNNPAYKVQNGVLLSKDGREIVGIPCEMESIVIDENVQKIVLTSDNDLKQIQIKADDISQLPELNLQNLDKCTITVPDSLAKDFIIQNLDELSESQIKVNTYEDRQKVYSVKNKLVLNEDNNLCMVTSESPSSVVLGGSIKSVEANAFERADNVNKIILSKDASVKLEKDALKNSNISTIVCNNTSQLDDIAGQLEVAGKDDVKVYVMLSNDEGYSYYVEGDGDSKTYVLMGAPEDVTEFSGQIRTDEGLITVDSIDSGCFSGCDSLQWVELPEKVKTIGTEAFDGCSALQGVIINSRDSVTIGNNAFRGCDSLRFVASNAMACNMENGYDPLISDSYGSFYNRNKYFFVLSDSQGYGDNVSVLAGDVSEMLLKDGILYGENDQGQDIAVLRASVDLSGDIGLSQSISQINAFAFADCSNVLNINLSSLTELVRIETGAFCNSGLSGDIRLTSGYGVWIADNAFTGCSGITNIDIATSINYLGSEAFSHCMNLEKVSIDSFNAGMGAGIETGMFTGCNNMKTLVINSDIPPGLIYFGSGYDYRFNNDWTEEEEAENLRIVVPDEARKDYLKDWRYLMCGYSGYFYGTEYLDMWNVMYSDMSDLWNEIYPTDEEVDKAVFDKLTERENQLRKMLGMETVSEPTDVYPIHIKSNLLTLAAVPTYITKLNCNDNDALGLPEGWYIDYLGKDVFSGARNLSNVLIGCSMNEDGTISNNLVGIYSGAFNNCSQDADMLTITFMGANPVELIKSDGEDFDFGIDTDKLTIIVPQGSKEAYIEAWSDSIDKQILEKIIIEEGVQTDDN